MFANKHIHLVVNQPHAYYCNLAGEFFAFNTVELIYIYLAKFSYIHHHLATGID